MDGNYDYQKLSDYVDAFESVWTFPPNRDLEEIFIETSHEEQNTIIEQLLSDAEWLEKATDEGLYVGDEIYWLEND